MRKINCVLILVLLTVFVFAFINPAMAENLFELAGEGSPEEVKKAVDAGADVNVRIRDETTPLMFAAQRNENPEVIKVLLDAGADVNAKDEDGWTSLMYAASNNENPEVIKVLLDAGADVNARDKYGWTPLMSAASNKNPEVIKVLLDAGADINARDKNGETPLMPAARWNKNPEGIKILLSAGADVNIRNNNGETPLLLATENNNIEKVKILVENGAEINIQTYYYYTPMMIAQIKHSNMEMFNYLLDEGGKTFGFPQINGDNLKALTNFLKLYFLEYSSGNYMKNVQSLKIEEAEKILAKRINTFGFFLEMNYSFNSSIEEDLNLLVKQLEQLANLELEIFKLSESMASKHPTDSKYQELFDIRRPYFKDYITLRTEIYINLEDLNNKIRSYL